MPSANLSACNPQRESKEKLNTGMAKWSQEGGRKREKEGSDPKLEPRGVKAEKRVFQRKKHSIQSFYREKVAAAETMDDHRNNLRVEVNRPGPEEERV